MNHNGFLDEEWEYWEDDPFPYLRESLAPEYEDLAAEDIEALLEGAGLSAEDLEFLARAARTVGRAVARAAPVAVPILGTAMGAFGGPAGAAIGGALGRAVGGAIAGRAPGAVTGRAPGAVTGRPPGAGATGEPGRVTPAARSPGPVRPVPAAGQLLQLLQRPEVVQALVSMAVGNAGRRQFTAASRSVPVGAVTNLIGALANQASAEYEAATSQADAGVSYLLDDAGEFMVDPAAPEQRAARLLELLEASEPWYPDPDLYLGDGDWDEEWLLEDVDD